MQYFKELMFLCLTEKKALSLYFSDVARDDALLFVAIRSRRTLALHMYVFIEQMLMTDSDNTRNIHDNIFCRFK